MHGSDRSFRTLVSFFAPGPLQGLLLIQRGQDSEYHWGVPQDIELHDTLGYCLRNINIMRGVPSDDTPKANDRIRLGSFNDLFSRKNQLKRAWYDDHFEIVLFNLVLDQGFDGGHFEFFSDLPVPGCTNDTEAVPGHGRELREC